MPITRATNLAGLGTIFDSLTDGGGLSVSGISTFTDLNITRVNITGVGTISNGSITNLTGTSSTITTFTSTNGSITNLIGTSSTITTLRSTTGNFTTGNIVTGVTTNFNAANVVITGVTTVSAGTVSLPSISPSGDPNTGIFFPSADHLNFSTGGTSRVQIDSDGDINIDGGGVFYDATNNRLAIGHTAPDSALHITSTSAGADPNHLILANISPTAGTTASLYFAPNLNGRTRAAAIKGINMAGGGGGNPTDLAFFTNPDGGPPTEKVRIDTSGRLLVGTSSADGVELIQVQGVSSSSSAPGGIALRRSSLGNTDDIGFINFTNASGNVHAAIRAFVDGTPGSGDYPGALMFTTTADGGSSPTERMRITSKGVLKQSNTGSYNDATGIFNEFNVDNANSYVVITRCTNATPLSEYIQDFRFSAATPNNANARFWNCEDATAQRAYLASNGGLYNYSANNSNLSDRNAKKDISVAAGTWDCIKEWEIVNYRYKDQPDDADLNLGVIAQQVAESCPEAITIFQEAKDATEDKPAQEERLGIKEQQMYWMAIKALQEAMGRIETLESSNTDLLARVIALESN